MGLTTKKSKKNNYKKAAVRRCSVKKVFLKVSQDSQENTCTRVFFLKKLLKKDSGAVVSL